MEKIFIRPAPGIRLFNPATGSMVPDSGLFAERNQYWSRRINEGGAIVFDPKNEYQPAAPVPAPGPAAAPVPAPVPAAAPEPAEETKNHPPIKRKK
jgi:hypothetical protein